jgi:aryl carrier-like protein
VKDDLRARLPEVMVPAHVTVLDDLPHTPNGKIDRNALPSLAEVLGRRSAAAPIAEAGSDLEREVLEVWKDILGTQRIGVDDNFFDLGGHSLLMVRLHRRLKDELGRPITLTDLYRHPTVRSFAASLSVDSSAATAQSSRDRAARRRDSLQRRRARR